MQELMPRIRYTGTNRSESRKPYISNVIKTKDSNKNNLILSIFKFSARNIFYETFGKYNECGYNNQIVG